MLKRMVNHPFYYYNKYGDIMKRINEVIIVEGKTDSAILKKIFDVDTIETNGIACDESTLEYIKKISQTRDIIVLTDPDFPGNQIRRRIQEIVPNCKHAFVEKKDAIKKGKVGVAEASEEAIIQAIENVISLSNYNESITWQEFLSLDIMGSKSKRLAIYNMFHLGYGNVKTLFKRLNMAGISKQDIVNRWNLDE